MINRYSKEGTLYFLHEAKSILHYLSKHIGLKIKATMATQCPENKQQKLKESPLFMYSLLRRPSLGSSIWLRDEPKNSGIEW